MFSCTKLFSVQSSSSDRMQAGCNYAIATVGQREGVPDVRLKWLETQYTKDGYFYDPKKIQIKAVSTDPALVKAGMHKVVLTQDVLRNNGVVLSLTDYTKTFTQGLNKIADYYATAKDVAINSQKPAVSFLKRIFSRAARI